METQDKDKQEWRSACTCGVELSKGWLVENEAQGRGGTRKVSLGFPEASGHQSGTGESSCQRSQFRSAQLSPLAYQSRVLFGSVYELGPSFCVLSFL